MCNRSIVTLTHTHLLSLSRWLSDRATNLLLATTTTPKGNIGVRAWVFSSSSTTTTTRTCTAPSSIMRCCWRVALSGGFQLHALACTHRRRPRLCTSGGTVCADVRRAAAAAFSTRPGRGRTYGTGNQKQRKRQGAACIACTRLRLITFIKYDFFFGLKYCHLARLWRLGRTIYILQIEVPVYLKRRLRMVHAYMMSSSTCSSVITLMMGTSSDRAQLVKKEWFMHVSSFFLPSLFNALESTTSFLRACLLIWNYFASLLWEENTVKWLTYSIDLQ